MGIAARRIRYRLVRRKEGFVKTFMRSLLGLAILAAVPAAAADLARYILPPGNFGGIPFTPNSTDQLPLYSSLSPLRDNITMADIDAHYLPEDFTPIGATTAEVITGHPGVQVLY